MMKNIEFNFEGEFAALRLIFYSLFATPILFIAVISAGVLTAPSMPSPAASEELLTMLIGVALLLSVAAPNLRSFLLKPNTQREIEQLQLESKFKRYRIAVVVSLIAWDGVATAGFVAAAIYGSETTCFSLSLLALIGMFFARPQESEVRSLS